MVQFTFVILAWRAAGFSSAVRHAIEASPEPKEKHLDCRTVRLGREVGEEADPDRDPTVRCQLWEVGGGALPALQTGACAGVGGEG